MTSDESLAATARAIGNHGGVRRYEHRVPGFNSRLDTLQAVVLRAKLARLEGWNEARRQVAARYDAAFGGRTDIGRAPVAPGNVHVWHLYVVRVADRDRVLAHLQENGVGAGIHYSAPVHLTEAFAWLGDGPGSHPNAEAASREMLSLPMYPHLAPADQDRVIATVLEALA